MSNGKSVIYLPLLNFELEVWYVGYSFDSAPLGHVTLGKSLSISEPKLLDLHGVWAGWGSGL